MTDALLVIIALTQAAGLAAAVKVIKGIAWLKATLVPWLNNISQHIGDDRNHPTVASEPYRLPAIHSVPLGTISNLIQPYRQKP